MKDDLLKGLEKDIKKEIEAGLREALICKCGHKLPEPRGGFKDNDLVACPFCGDEVRVRISVKKRP